MEAREKKMKAEHILERKHCNENCTYLMFLGIGNNKCYLLDSKCNKLENQKKCRYYVNISDIQTIYHNFTDIPQILLNDIIENSILNVHFLVCHHLSRILKLYFHQLPKDILYQGQAYRLTNNIQQEKASADFFNFSKEADGYNGAVCSDLCGQSGNGKKYREKIIGVDVVKLLNKYYKGNNKLVWGIVENEKTIIGKYI